MSRTQDLVKRLQDAGFEEPFLRATLPDWATSEESASGQMMLRLLLARRLNLDPEALMDDSLPLGFLQSGPIKFKHMRLGPGPRRETLTGFALGVTRILLAAAPTQDPQAVPPALELREAVIASGRDNIGFGDVLSVCWSLGIPVLHLRLFPAQTKGITAMAVRIGGQHAILVARESGIPAQYMFHVAHELGHIALGHLKDISAILDADPDDPANANDRLIDDEEEKAADTYAQALLSGQESFTVSRDLAGKRGTAAELAERAKQLGADLMTDPGHVIMSFGHSTKEWPLAMAAAKLVAGQDESPASLVNRVLWDQLIGLSDDQALHFLRAVAPV